MSCIYRNCRSTWRTSEISFHTVPKKNFKPWLKALGISTSNWQWNRKHKVCSRHFEEHYFDRTGQTVRLREGAVPTLNLPIEDQSDSSTETASSAAESSKTLFHFGKILPLPETVQQESSFQLEEAESLPETVKQEGSFQFEATAVLPETFQQGGNEIQNGIRHTHSRKNASAASNQSLMYLIPTQNAIPKSCLNAFKAQIVVSNKGQNLILTPINDDQFIQVPEPQSQQPQPEFKTPETQNSLQNEAPKKHKVVRYCGDFKSEGFNDLSTATQYVKVAQAQISKLKQKIKTITQQNRRLLSKLNGGYICFSKKQLNEWKTKIKFYNLESLENVCKLCLNKGNLVELKDQKEKNFDVKGGFLEFVLDDSIPEKVCKQCCIEISQMTLLIEKYRLAQNKFKEYEKILEDATSMQSENVQETVILAPETENLDALCEKCGISVTDMTQHLKENVMCKPTYTCPKCSKVFFDVGPMKRHISRHYKIGNFMCHICAKTFKFKPNLNRHLKVHNLGKRFMCEYCAKSFTTNFTLQQHMNGHRNVKPHKCKYCEKKFSSHGAKCHHENQHERQMLRERAKSDRSDEINSKTPETFTCEDCGRAFGKFRSLLLHKTTHNENQVFTCTICKEKFPARHILAKHYEKHALNMRFMCHYCPKRFRTGLSLRKHEMIHTGERPYGCDVCGKKFRQPQHLSHHMLMHTNEKPYQCEICSKGFTSKATLIVHLRLHTGETPFECHVCKKGFRDVAVRKKHVFAKHGREEVERIPNVFDQDVH